MAQNVMSVLDDTDRRATAEEMAETFVYLVSDESSYITGQIWAINGGLDM